MLIWLSPLAVEAQIKKVAERDKAQIIKTILKNYNFIKDSAVTKDNTAKTIYLFVGNIPSKQIPQIKGIDFVFITQKEIDKLDKTVPDYYQFGEFRVKKKSVRTYFARLYLHPVNGDGTVTRYECRKIAGKWKIRQLSEMEFADNPLKNAPL
ncbi:MAG: hypothetical protein LC768_05500 [Acidobacteria bacterium]|nr:hypothetical protein [Acidobacteriota bacterium]